MSNHQVSHCSGRRNIIRSLASFIFLALSFGLAPLAQGKPPFTVTCPKTAKQGEAILVSVSTRTPPETIELSWLGSKISPPLQNSRDKWIAYALLPAAIEQEPGQYPLLITVFYPTGKETSIRQITVQAKNYAKQRLTLSPGLVDLDEESRARVSLERQEVLALLGGINPLQYWSAGFVRPVGGKVTSAFGLKRSLNNGKSYRHKGVDFRGRLGDPVLSSGAGIVALAAYHYLGGKSVFIDHGLGVVSAYLHLSETMVEKDEIVHAGQIIGRIGSTGRSTGPHLHFGMSVLGQWVDPLPAFGAPKESETALKKGKKPPRRVTSRRT